MSRTMTMVYPSASRVPARKTFATDSYRSHGIQGRVAPPAKRKSAVATKVTTAVSKRSGPEVSTKVYSPKRQVAIFDHAIANLLPHRDPTAEDEEEEEEFEDVLDGEPESSGTSDEHSDEYSDECSDEYSDDDDVDVAPRDRPERDARTVAAARITQISIEESYTWKRFLEEKQKLKRNVLVDQLRRRNAHWSTKLKEEIKKLNEGKQEAEEKAKEELDEVKEELDVAKETIQKLEKENMDLVSSRDFAVSEKDLSEEEVKDLRQKLERLQVDYDRIFEDPGAAMDVEDDDMPPPPAGVAFPKRQRESAEARDAESAKRARSVSTLVESSASPDLDPGFGGLLSTPTAGCPNCKRLQAIIDENLKKITRLNESFAEMSLENNTLRTGLNGAQKGHSAAQEELRKQTDEHNKEKCKLQEDAKKLVDWANAQKEDVELKAMNLRAELAEAREALRTNEQKWNFQDKKYKSMQAFFNQDG